MRRMREEYDKLTATMRESEMEAVTESNLNRTTNLNFARPKITNVDESDMPEESTD